MKIQHHLIPILESVSDPEIPVINIMELGVVREAYEDQDHVYVKITPTYSGCPAMDVIGDDIKKAFLKIDKQAHVQLILSEAWTTDWITQSGKDKMRAYGIAPPLSPTADKEALLGNARIVKCTNCASQNTKLVSQFGSTACKALFQCEDCLEPFDYFKCLR